MNIKKSNPPETLEEFRAKHPNFPEQIARAFFKDNDEFKKILDQMYETYQKKNSDYGSSFTNLMDEFGMVSLIIRLTDKLNRLKSITKKNEILVKDESMEDTLLDLANYAVLGVQYLRTHK